MRALGIHAPITYLQCVGRGRVHARWNALGNGLDTVLGAADGHGRANIVHRNNSHSDAISPSIQGIQGYLFCMRGHVRGKQNTRSSKDWRNTSRVEVRQALVTGLRALRR